MAMTTRIVNSTDQNTFTISSLEDQTTTNNEHNMPSVLSAATASNTIWDIVQRITTPTTTTNTHHAQLFISSQVFPSRPTKLQSTSIFFLTEQISSKDMDWQYLEILFASTGMSPRALKHPLNS